MTKVVDLSEARLRPVPEVVELMEQLLARARTGEIRGIAVGAACAGRHTASAFVVGDAAIADLYLGIERVRCRLLAYAGDEDVDGWSDG